MADEIRRLAGRVADHTKEITSIIAGVKEGIERVAQAQYKTSRLIEKGSELLNNVDSVFEHTKRTPQNHQVLQPS